MILLDIALNAALQEPWISIDKEGLANIPNLDIQNNPLPFEERSVDGIYSSHTLEHIWPENVPHVFSEFYRVLGRDAIIRIVVPDFGMMIHKYVENPFWLKKVGQFPPNCPNISIYNLMTEFYNWYWQDNQRVMGHVWGYDFEALAYYLSNVKFRNITRMFYGVYGDSIKFDGKDIEGHKETSIYVEAIK